MKTRVEGTRPRVDGAVRGWKTAAWSSMIALLCSLLGCSDAARPDDGSCTAGQRGCPCAYGNTCSPDPDGARLNCVDGFCVPAADCPIGSEGCACYSNGSCDPLDGVPMTCSGNVCVETEMVDPGEIGSGCEEDEDCTGAAECVDGICEDPTCPLGEIGCACGPYGQCDEYHGETTRCVDGVCQLGSCEPGTLGCTCDDSDSCGQGLICERGLCLNDANLGVRIGNPNVRACDLLISGAERTAVVHQSDQIRAQHVQRAPQLSVSFIARSDEALAGEILTIELTAEPAEVSRLTIAQSECYDRLGHPVADPMLILE